MQQRKQQRLASTAKHRSGGASSTSFSASKAVWGLRCFPIPFRCTCAVCVADACMPVSLFLPAGTSGRQWRDEWRDFYDPGRGGQGGEHGKRAREEFEASLIASRMPPVDPRAYPRNVRHKWVPGGGGVPGGPVGGGPPGFGPPGARPPGGPRRGPPPFGGPPPPDDRRHQSHENPFAYNRKFARGRRN